MVRFVGDATSKLSFTSNLVSITSRQHNLVCINYIIFFKIYLIFFVNFRKLLKNTLPCAFYKTHGKQIALPCVLHVAHDKELPCAPLKTHGKEGSAST
jgi:hypothetical protein